MREPGGVQTEPGVGLRSDGRERLQQTLLAAAWERPLAYLAVAVGLTLALNARQFGPDLAVVAYTFAAGTYFFFPVPAFGLLGLAPGRAGRLLAGIALVLLWLGALWLGASYEFHREQSRHLLWPELQFRLGDPASREVARGFLLDWPVATLTAGIAAGYLILRGGFRRLGRPLCAALTLVGFSTVLLAGTLVASGWVQGWRHASLEACRAPWAGSHFGRSAAAHSPVDLAAARRIRREVQEPFWVQGPAPVLASLAGRYPGRSIVLVVLESHRASDVGGLGEGASAHQDCSPRLAALGERGLRFDRYYNFSLVTVSMLWGALTGLPGRLDHPASALRSPEATQVGRLPDFKALGYDLEALCPAPAGFDNWDRLWGTVGARSWIDTAETRELPRDRWTSWGMPDDQLYALAERRYQDAAKRKRPIFLTLLTVSNHVPYSLPAGFAPDHCGGMRFADDAVGSFVDRLSRLPADQQPLLMITSDTSHFEQLHRAEPLGRLGPEGARVPGVLLTPDGYGAGERFEGAFGHEDLLDFLYFAVAPAGRAGDRFGRKHRVVLAGGLGPTVVSSTSYYVAPTREAHLLEGAWRLRPVSRLPDQERIERAARTYQEQLRALWP